MGKTGGAREKGVGEKIWLREKEREGRGGPKGEEEGHGRIRGRNRKRDSRREAQCMV